MSGNMKSFKNLHRFFLTGIGVAILILLVQLVVFLLPTSGGTPPPPPHGPPPPIDEPLVEALSLLLDESDMGTIDVKGTTCLDFWPDKVETLSQKFVLQLPRLLALRFAQNTELASEISNMMLSEIGDNATERFIVFTALAERQIASRNFSTAVQTLDEILPHIQMVDPCFAADALYLSGRLNERRGRLDDAVVSYQRAASLEAIHIPAQLALVNATLATVSGSEDLQTSIVALNQLKKIANVRMYAADQVLKFQDSQCESANCSFFQALMLSWTNLPSASLQKLDEFEAVCNRTGCLPEMRTASDTLRQRLLQEDDTDASE